MLSTVHCVDEERVQIFGVWLCLSSNRRGPLDKGIVYHDNE